MKTEKTILKGVVLLAFSVLGLSSLQGQEPLNTTIERDTSVVYQPMNQTLSVPENYNQGASSGERLVFEYFLDLNGDTINDFKFSYTLVIPLYTNWQNDNDYSISIHPLNNNRVIDFVSTDSSKFDSFLAGFNKDTEISGVLGSEYDWVNGSRVIIGSNRFGSFEGSYRNDEGFFSVEPTYTGLEFNIEGQTYYGWMLMDFSLRENSSQGQPAPNFLGYAYETEAGVAIMTGEIPEPSTYSLWVGIFSALAVVISKRFRILK